MMLNSFFFMTSQAATVSCTVSNLSKTFNCLRRRPSQWPDDPASSYSYRVSGRGTLDFIDPLGERSFILSLMNRSIKTGNPQCTCIGLFSHPIEPCFVVCTNWWNIFLSSWCCPSSVLFLRNLPSCTLLSVCPTHCVAIPILLAINSGLVCSSYSRIASAFLHNLPSFTWHSILYHYTPWCFTNTRGYHAWNHIENKQQTTILYLTVNLYSVSL